MRISLALVTLLVCVATAELTKEEILARCRNASKEEMGECLVKIIKEIQPRYEAGLPEFNIPPTDRIAVGDFKLNQYDSENSYLKGRIYDVTTKGLHEMQIPKLRMDYEKHTVELDAEIPELVMTGRYEVDSLILMVPLKGDGTFWSRMEDIRAQGKSEFTVDKDIDGKYRLLPVKSDMDFTYKKFSVQLNGLYPDNEILQQAASAMLNENTDYLFEEMKPEIKATLIELAHGIATNLSRSTDLKDVAGYEYLKEEFKIPDE